MARPKTGFDRYFDARMKDPKFAAGYSAALTEIESIDALVRALDEARKKEGLTKAALAERAGMKPEVLRRLFTVDAPNPTVETILKLAGVLKYSLNLVPRSARAQARI